MSAASKQTRLVKHVSSFRIATSLACQQLVKLISRHACDLAIRELHVRERRGYSLVRSVGFEVVQEALAASVSVLLYQYSKQTEYLLSRKPFLTTRFASSAAARSSSSCLRRVSAAAAASAASARAISASISSLDHGSTSSVTVSSFCAFTYLASPVSSLTGYGSLCLCSAKKKKCSISSLAHSGTYEATRSSCGY